MAASPIAKWMPPLAGVIAAALVSSLVCGTPRAHSLSWAALLMTAGMCALTVFLGCDLTVRIACAIYPNAGSLKPRNFPFQISAAAVWFAPLNLFLQRQSALAMAAAAVLAAAASAAVYSDQLPSGAGEMPGEANEPKAGDIFRSLHPRPLFRELFPALCLALLAEGAAVASLVDQPTTATGLTGIFAALLVWSINQRVMRYERRKANGERSKSGGFLLVVLAVVFTVIGLLPYLRFGSGPYSEGNRSRSPSSESEGSLARQLKEEAAADPGGGYPGIILWPKTLKYVKLIAPPPALVDSALSLGQHAFAISIPFDGVYWFFRAPDTHPSRKLRVVHGSPEEFNIRSTDGRPLLTEAHQNLGTLINLNCCSKIQVAIQNADRYPGTVWLEVILRDTALPGKPSLSLGTDMVASTPPRKLNDERKALSEVLSFDVPGLRKISQFDEVTVVFRLAPDRSEVGAKIGIERFILVPRGL